VCVAASIVARGCAGRCSVVIERKTQFPAPLPVSAAIFQHTRNNNNKKIKKVSKNILFHFF
jgi:S-adenosylmethionine synthetase